MWEWLCGNRRQLTRIEFSILALGERIDRLKQEIRVMVREAYLELKEAIDQAANVQEAAIELIKGLADRLAEIAEHPSAEEIRALSTEMRRRAGELADAIALHADEEGEEEEKEE